ncbi:MAG TPA: hypothetical protein DCY86_15565 [Bdellovibrionales bacterium]|nr:hypothetical protein [Bdellovibrionales bacterium]
MRGPVRKKFLGPVFQQMCYGTKSFHVIDDGGAAFISPLDRKGGPDPRLASLAFQRFKQGRLLTADIGTGP